MKILIVDDSPFICRFIKGTLQEAGFKDVRYVCSAVEAFEVLGLHNPEKKVDIDLILMDIVMSEIDGIEACTRIKSAEHLRDIPLIMITAKTEDRFLEAAFNAGVVDYITKPLRKVALLARIRSALALKKEMDRRKAREKELLNVTHLLEIVNKKLQEQTFLDGLTGIANRRRLEEFIGLEWRRARRNAMPISLVMVDIDLFKAFNDNYGHLAGDECLKQVAQVLRKVCRRPGDLAARYGGDEFALVLSETGAEDAAFLAEELRNTVQKLDISHAFSPVKNITISLGVASLIPDKHTPAEALVKFADLALYRAKQIGRNQVNVHLPAFHPLKSLTRPD